MDNVQALGFQGMGQGLGSLQGLHGRRHEPIQPWTRGSSWWGRRLRPRLFVNSLGRGPAGGIGLTPCGSGYPGAQLRQVQHLNKVEHG